MNKVLLRLSIMASTAVFILLNSPLVPAVRAQQEPSSKATDKLEQKIKDDIVQQLEKKITEDLLQQLPQEVMKVLLKQNLLNRQIERGIDDYFKKQQQAQAIALEKQEQIAREKASRVRRVTGSRDHIYGNPNAPVSLIEYSDFECPFCKGFHSIPREIVDASAGKVNWVYRHFPLDMHNPGALKEAEATECANDLGGNDAFWRYASTIYARTQSNGKGFPLSQLGPVAKEIGLNKKQFQQCIDTDKFAPRVEEDIDEGRKIGVAATPTNILLDNEEGQVIVKSGALPSEAFKLDIEKMLAKYSPAKNAALQ